MSFEADRNVVGGRRKSSRTRIIEFGLACGLALILEGRAVAHEDLHGQIEEVSRTIAKTPTAELYLKRGELQRVHEDYGAALSDYEAAEKLNPRLDAVWLCQGRALLEAGHPGPARLALDRFLQRMPGHAAGHLFRARAQAKLARGQPAVDDYDRAIALSVEPLPEYFVERAALLADLGELEAALGGLEAGMKVIGPIPSLQLPALEIELKLARHEAALRRVDGLIAAAERKEQWQARRAEILAQAGRAAEAREAGRAALASIENLPARMRSAPAMQQLEGRLRAAWEENSSRTETK